MTDFDWNTGPARPLTLGDVWELLRNGCNAHEVATAAGVAQPVADAMVRRALDRQVLTLPAKAA